MTERRVVRVTADFFDRLDALLPTERTADGRCSAAYFIELEIPDVVELLSTDLGGCTMPYPDDPTIRVFVATSILVAGFVVYAELVADGSVEVFWLEIDPA